MGTGYGVYIYQGETAETTFVDDRLRPGKAYAYRVETAGSLPGQTLAIAAVETYNHGPVAGGGLASALTVSSPKAATNRPNVAIIPAPTPLPPDALLLGLMSDASYTDDFNTLSVAGEIRNDSNLDVGEISVIASFYDASGNFIHEARSAAMLKSLAPGQRSPFLLNLDRPAGMSNYSIKAVGRPIPASLSPQINIVSMKRYEDTIGFYHVEGVIQNAGSIPVDQARVIVTLYARGGAVINVGFAYPNPTRLHPGDRATFDVKFTYFPKVVDQSVVVAE
jgi:hypothetical protein